MALRGRDLIIYVANLCLDVNLLKVMLVFWYFVFFPIVMVTIRGEVRAEYICVVCTDCWALSLPM